MEASMAKDSMKMTDTATKVTASTLKLDSQLLTNNGLQIETREGMGRVAFTTKKFDKMYEKVIREKPALVWEVDNMFDYVQKFKEADAKTQASILDMYHPPLSAPSVAKLKKTAATLAMMGVDHDMDFIHKLLAIATTNAHQYYGETAGAAEHGDLRQYETIGGNATARKKGRSCERSLGATVTLPKLPQSATT